MFPDFHVCAVAHIHTYKHTQQPGGGATFLYSQHQRDRGRQSSEFEASLVYKVSSRTARATQRNPVLENERKKEKKKERKKKKEREERRKKHPQ